MMTVSVCEAQHITSQLFMFIILQHIEIISANPVPGLKLKKKNMDLIRVDFWVTFQCFLCHG